MILDVPRWIALRREGLSTRQIAKLTGFPHATIAQLAQLPEDFTDGRQKVIGAGRRYLEPAARDLLPRGHYPDAPQAPTGPAFFRGRI